MMILGLVRNYIPSYQWVVKGGWNIADCAARSYDAEGMHVGTVAAGRIGLAIMRRLKPFDMHLHYFDRHRLPLAVERELGLAWHPTVEDMVKVCDVVTINAPLHPETENLFDDAMLSKMKRGAYLVNTARGKICDRDAVVRALESGRLAGYAGDVWFPQPPAKDHPWRTMPHHGMTPHVSGTSLSAQARYAAGTREILECWFNGRPIRDEYLIVEGGKLAGAGAHAYSAGDTTGGAEEAARSRKSAASAAKRGVVRREPSGSRRIAPSAARRTLPRPVKTLGETHMAQIAVTDATTDLAEVSQESVQVVAA
jgi:formate dehydrogenase